jgi:hypothetical protein
MTNPNEPQRPQYGQPQYGQPQYGQPQYGQPSYPPAPPAARPSLSDRIGPRITQRPEPRLGVSLAGVGIAVAVLGVIVWGGGYLLSGIQGNPAGSSDSHRILGVVLSLLVVIIGYLAAGLRRRGPVATAGVVANALGVPVLVGFLSFDASSSSSGLPVSTDAVVIVSVCVWLLSYLLMPGSRGHAFYLGLATITLWIYVIGKAQPHAISSTSTFGGSTFGSSTSLFSGIGKPDFPTIAGISLTFGLGYYLIAYALDRAGRHGPAVSLALGGFLATAVGIAAAAPSLHSLATGVLLILLGAVLAAYGASGGRRFTTWVWSAAVGLGVIVIVAKLWPNNDAAAGIALIVSGLVVVVAGQVLCAATGEASDVPTIARNAIH